MSDMTEITEESLSVVLQPLLEGLGRAVGTTLFASVTAYAIGLFLGIVLLVARTSGGKPLAALVAVYVSFMRGTPLLVQLLIAFYVIPSLINIQFSPLAAGILALALNTTAYISEILRGALSTLPRGQSGPPGWRSGCVRRRSGGTFCFPRCFTGPCRR